MRKKLSGFGGELSRMVYQILIVEDEEDLIGAYTEALGEQYKILTAPSGKDAIELVKLQKGIDLAVVDYRLPDMSGIDVMKEIKDLAPSVPVIIITAYGDEDVAVAAFRGGARDYLKKPFSISELCAKIDFYVALKHADKRRRKNIVFEEDETSGSGSSPLAVTPGQYCKIQRAVRYINDNYRSDISFDDAAREADMSSTHFSRIFKKVMGLSYQEYLHSRRVAKAQNLLRTSALSITEIAHTVGYTDITGFERIFKKLTRHTPTAYRNLPKT